MQSLQPQRLAITSYNKSHIKQQQPYLTILAMTNDQKPDDMSTLQAQLERGAEPYWMQDIRLALRRLEAARRVRKPCVRPASEEASEAD